MPIIDLQDVSKIYGFGDATTLALDEVNLSVERGEFVAIMGPSGCGKSTLLNIIGLLDKPTHGHYTISGRYASRLRPKQQAKVRRDSIGFIFQSFNLLPKLNVIENVALPLAYKRVLHGKRLRIASNMLEQVGLSDRAFFMPKQLSGGQSQRVAIARALINDPKIIIADEPTGNLDSGSSRLVMELLSEIHKNGNTVLMVTHNPELTRYANRVVYMLDGSIVHDELSKIGEIATTAKKSLVFVSKYDDEDDLAGVSALMKAIPKAGDDKLSKRKVKKPRRKKSSVKMKKRTRKTNVSR